MQIDLALWGVHNTIKKYQCFRKTSSWRNIVLRSHKFQNSCLKHRDWNITLISREFWIKYISIIFCKIAICTCVNFNYFLSDEVWKGQNIFFRKERKKGKMKFLRVYSRKHNGILWNGETAALVGRNGWPPDVRSVHVAAIISYRCVQLVGTQRNPANLYLALVSHEYSGRNHSVLHELLHYYRDFPITNYAKFGFRITTKQPATTSMGSVIDIGKCLACETSLLLFKLQYRTRIKG